MLKEYLARYAIKIYFNMSIRMYFLKFTHRLKNKAFDLKSNFHIMFKAYRDKMLVRQQQLAKQPTNYEQQLHKKSYQFEQKPLKNFNEFSDSEENETKQHAQKRLAERREKSEVEKEK